MNWPTWPGSIERRLAQQRVLAEQSNPFIGELDQAALDRVQAADQAAVAGVGLTPRAARSKPRPVTASDYLGRAKMTAPRIRPLPARAAPLPGESLASLVRRTAEAMGYEGPGASARCFRTPETLQPMSICSPPGLALDRLAELLRRPAADVRE